MMIIIYVSFPLAILDAVSFVISLRSTFINVLKPLSVESGIQAHLFMTFSLSVYYNIRTSYSIEYRERIKYILKPFVCVLYVGITLHIIYTLHTIHAKI